MEKGVNTDTRHRIGGVIFRRAVECGALRDGVAEGVELAGWPIVLAIIDGQPQAAINRCTHAAAAFVAHGAQFAMKDGRCLGGLYKPLRTFACRIVDDWVEIDVPDAPPGVDEQPVTR
jgi:anthranilate 1,2-dioxygenase ferredoxin component